MHKYYLVAAIAALITAFSQLALKLGALYGNKKNSVLRSYLNPYTIIGYFLLFVVTLLSVYVFKYIDLKVSVVLLPMTFVFVTLLSFGVLKERFSRNNYIGSAIILIGIVVFSL